MEPDYFAKRSLKMKKQAFPVEIVAYDFSSDSNLLIPWHKHEEIELLLVESGNAYVTVNEKTIDVHEGDIFFINQNVSHFITPFLDRNVSIKSIIMLPSLLFGVGKFEMEKKYMLPVLHSKIMEYLYIAKSNNQHNFFYSNITKIIELELSKTDGHELLTTAHLLMLWDKLYYLCKTNSANDNTKISSFNKYKY